MFCLYSPASESCVETLPWNSYMLWVCQTLEHRVPMNLQVGPSLGRFFSKISRHFLHLILEVFVWIDFCLNGDPTWSFRSLDPYIFWIFGQRRAEEFQHIRTTLQPCDAGSAEAPRTLWGHLLNSHLSPLGENQSCGFMSSSQSSLATDCLLCNIFWTWWALPAMTQPK